MSHFLNRQELTLDDLLKRLPSRIGPVRWSLAHSTSTFVIRSGASRPDDRGMRASGSELTPPFSKSGYRFFTPPPPPSYVPKDVFMAKIKEAIEKRFHDTIAAVEKLRARGGKLFSFDFPLAAD